MERRLILLVAALAVYVASGVQGTSYSNNIQVNISQNGCGVTKLCVQTPVNCDPTGNTSCLFASVISSTPIAPNGSMSFQLRGDSMGYIALGLTVNASQGTTMLFICAQNSSNNGSFFFQTMDQNNTNNVLIPAKRITTEIRGIVKGNVIKCEFNVPNENSTTFSILLGTGTITNDGPNPFNISLNSGLLNLANPASNIPTTAPPVVNTTVANPTVANPTVANATVANPTVANTTVAKPTVANATVAKPTVANTTVANTTVAKPTVANTTVAKPTVANSAGAVQPHAVLLLLSVLTLSVLLRA